MPVYVLGSQEFRSLESALKAAFESPQALHVTERGQRREWLSSELARILVICRRLNRDIQKRRQLTLDSVPADVAINALRGQNVR